MKNRFLRNFISVACFLVSIGTASGQVVVQHLGAIDPRIEGFRLSLGEPAEIGPVFDDLGFDAWKIRSTSHNDWASYAYTLTDQELQAAMDKGWRLSAQVRFVETSEDARFKIEFNMGTRRFRVAISGVNDREIVPSGDDIDPFSIDLDALDYHEYELRYNPLLDRAALWVDGVEHKTDIFGREVQTSVPVIIFGATGESITHSHWNEVTFEIIPEPATVALLAGVGALLATSTLRRRQFLSNKRNAKKSL